MHNFSINQIFKKIKYFDSFDYLIIFLINLFKKLYGQEGKPSTEKSKISNNQIWFFWFFDYFDVTKKFHTQTDRQTFGLIEATCRRLINFCQTLSVKHWPSKIQKPWFFWIIWFFFYELVKKSLMSSGSPSQNNQTFLIIWFICKNSYDKEAIRSINK